MTPDLLARFIIGGALILLAAEHLGIRDFTPARNFFFSPAWVVLRYTLFGAVGVLCFIVLLTDWG